MIIKCEINNRFYRIDTKNMKIITGSVTGQEYFTYSVYNNIYAYSLSDNLTNYPLCHMGIVNYTEFTCVKDYINYIKERIQ